ncbi:MAG: hypothetical protein IPP48_06280 [Chitinophagaceae bacterium]|nr:hypothetical protein [Chitinophagaceae bacterium]
MRQFLSYSFIYFFLTSCTQPKQDEKNIIVKTFYSTARIKEILSLNKDSLKDGICFYFNEDGYLDSSVEYKTGKLDGIKNKYYPDYGIYSYEYKNDTLICHKMYDTLNELKYQTPLDIKSIGKTEFYFKSNRNYFDQDKVDTITIINSGLPYYNRGISITGAIISRITDREYSIRTSKHFDDLKEIKIQVFIKQHLGDTTEVPFIFDTFSIPVK